MVACPPSLTEFFTALVVGNLVTTGKSINFIQTYYFAMCKNSSVTLPKIDMSLDSSDSEDGDLDEDPDEGQLEQFMFMELADSTLATVCDKCMYRDKYNPYNTAIFEGFIIQTLHALAMIQGYGKGDLKIDHNDIHLDNIFVTLIDETVVWKGQKLIDADYFHYKAGAGKRISTYPPVIVLLFSRWVTGDWHAILLTI